MAIEIVKVIDYKIFLVIFTDYIRGKLSAYLVEIHGSHLFRIYFSIRGGIRILAHCAAGAPGVRRGYKKLKSTWVNGSNFTWRCWTQVRDPKNRKQILLTGRYFMPVRHSDFATDSIFSR